MIFMNIVGFCLRKETKPTHPDEWKKKERVISYAGRKRKRMSDPPHLKEGESRSKLASHCEIHCTRESKSPGITLFSEFYFLPKANFQRQNCPFARLEYDNIHCNTPMLPFYLSNRHIPRRVNVATRPADHGCIRIVPSIVTDWMATEVDIAWWSVMMSTEIDIYHLDILLLLHYGAWCIKLFFDLRSKVTVLELPGQLKIFQNNES